MLNHKSSQVTTNPILTKLEQNSEGEHILMIMFGDQAEEKDVIFKLCGHTHSHTHTLFPHDSSSL